MAQILNNLVFSVIKPVSTEAKAPSACYETATPSLCFFPQLNSLVSWETIIGGHLTYAVLIFTLRKFMQDRQEMQGLKIPMLIYNFVQIIVSLLMVIGMLPYFLQFPNFFNINGLFTAEIEFWVLCHFLAKFLDMFDTVFIVLRKKDKQFSFLHVYHHFTIGVIWGGLLHFGVGNGTAYFGAWINSLVHALMYGHYFFSSLGFENPLKTYLTQFQMFQFFLCIVHAILVSLVVTNNYPSSVSYVQMAYHPTLLYLFYDYLMNEKKLAKKLKQQKAAAAAAAISNNNNNAGSTEGSVEPSTPVETKKKTTTTTTTRSSSGNKSTSAARGSSAKKKK